MTTHEKLIYMANQIARNLEIQGKEEAVALTAKHITAFWDPRMKAAMAAHVAGDGEGLSAIAFEALRLVGTSKSSMS